MINLNAQFENQEMDIDSDDEVQDVLEDISGRNYIRAMGTHKSKMVQNRVENLKPMLIEIIVRETGVNEELAAEAVDQLCKTLCSK